jgi:hypothetical protein
VRKREHALVIVSFPATLLSICGREISSKTSGPSPTGAVYYALIGLPGVGGGLMMANSLVSGDPSGNSGSCFMSLLGALMFLGVGGWMWRKAYKAFNQWRVYGTSHLQMESEPVSFSPYRCPTTSASGQATTNPAAARHLSPLKRRLLPAAAGRRSD